MPDDNVAAIACGCLAAWSRGDLDTTRWLLADGVRFIGPPGATTGVGDSLEGIRGMVSIADHVEMRKVFAEDENGASSTAWSPIRHRRRWR